ncbi:hypothetical protein C5167_018932 [Papaver somniferum]|uniref:Sucrose phosphatase-like domain-containing protein n=1 Tax=Papaver somniferum TaxID=3469 RepID=A0A4Y7IQU5_PAPSO|nr:hypothetical protein C5167_018932 [Papaver somniferum]
MKSILLNFLPSSYTIISSCYLAYLQERLNYIKRSESQQRQYKVSFDVEKEKAEGVIKALSERLEKRGRFGDDKQPRNTLVCGDSGNDAEPYTVPVVYGIMLHNAMEELLQWHTENVKNNPKIIHATKRCAFGIIQAIGHFKLGLNLSSRDVVDFP